MAGDCSGSRLAFRTAGGGSAKRCRIQRCQSGRTGARGFDCCRRGPRTGVLAQCRFLHSRDAGRLSLESTKSYEPIARRARDWRYASGNKVCAKRSVFTSCAGALGRVDCVCCGTLGAPSTGSARSVRSRCDGLRCAARVFGNRCSHRSDPPTAHQTKIFIGYAGYRSDGGLRGGHSSTCICAKCFLGRRSYGGRRHCLDRAHVQLQRRSSNRGPGMGQSPRPGGLPSRVSGRHGRWKHPLGCARYSNGGQSGSVGCGLRLNSGVDAYHSLSASRRGEDRSKTLTALARAHDERGTATRGRACSRGSRILH